MSRIGKQPISVPQNVQVTLAGNTVTVKGPKTSLSVTVHHRIKVRMDADKLIVERPSDEQMDRALHGLSRALLQNLVTGVTTGFVKKLELSGVGFRAQVQGKKLTLMIGFS